MKFGYAVKYNGKYYPANTEIPEEKTAPVEETPKVATPVVEKPVETVETEKPKRVKGNK